MNLKGFIKTSDDGRIATLRHEKGHEVRIVRRALDKKTLALLDALPRPEQHYDAGGEVVPDPTQGLQPTEPIATPAAPAPGPAAQPPVTINISNAPQEQQQAPFPARIGQAVGSVARHLPLPGGLTGAQLADVPALAEKGMQTAGQFAEGLGSGVSGNPLQSPAAPTAAGTPAPASLLPSPATAAPAAAPDLTPSPQDMASKNYEKALGLGMQGLSEQQAAETQLAKSRDKMLGQAALQSADLETETRANLQNNLKEIEAIRHDIANNQIKPKAYLENATAGEKIRTAIGLVIAGIGSGKGENPVLKMMDQQVERDLDAQKKNLDSKQSLLGALQRQTGDIRAAGEMFKAIRATTIMHQLDQAAAQAGTPMAKAHADQAKSQMLQQYAPVLMKASLMSAVSKLTKAGDPDAVGKMLPQLRMYDPAMAKEMEGRYVPGVGLASVPLDQTTRNTLESRAALQDSVHRLREYARQHEGTVLDRAAVEYGNTLSKTVQDAYRRANGQGVFKESESKFVNGIVAEDPTAFFNKFRVDPKLRALEDSNRNEMNGLRKSVGLPLAEAPGRIETKDGVPYMQTPQGWRRLKQ